jgi:hypothetical protein
MDVLDPKMDNVIRAALLKADREGKLGRIAAVTGIAGGVDELRKIMHSTGELHIMDRGMIGMHFAV